MGNQNTSGISEDEKAANKVPEKLQVSDPRDQEEANHIAADGITDFQEKAAEADSQDSEEEEEADHRVIKPAEKEVSDEHEGPVNDDAGAKTTTLHNLTTEYVEPIESSFAKNIMSELNKETHDQPSTLKGEKQRNEANSKPAIDIVLESQEDENVLANEIVKTQQVDIKDDLSIISLQNLCVEENENQNGCSSCDDEEKPTANELGNWDKTSCVEQTQPFDQETDQLTMVDQSDPSDALVQTELSHPMAENENDQEDNNSSSGDTIHETELSTDIEQGDEIEQNSDNKKAILLDDIEKFNIESMDKGSEVELKKSPSFDFRLPIKARPGESEQTPLLYKGTATRSLSSCSAMRYQNRSVQTEHYEAMDVEEKTIRMERSNSQISYLSLNLQNKKENNVDIVTKATHDNSSPSREDCDVISSPTENGKRKLRSTFFTTCICCTAAIN